MAEETNKIHDGDAASKILLAPTGLVPRERRGFVAARHPPPAASDRRNHRRAAAMLSLVTLLCPPSSSRSIGGGIETYSFAVVVGLVNVAPPIACSRPTAPMRGGGLGCRRNRFDGIVTTSCGGGGESSNDRILSSADDPNNRRASTPAKERRTTTTPAQESVDAALPKPWENIFHPATAGFARLRHRGRAIERG